MVPAVQSASEDCVTTGFLVVSVLRPDKSKSQIR